MNYRDFLEQAAALFQEKYPGTSVEIQTFSAMPDIKTTEGGDTRMTLIQEQDDPRDRSAYINRVNTALMSGEGADIYAMDILPLHTFVEQGQLENLEPYMAGDPAWVSAGYRANILEAAKYRGGLWFLPLDYRFDYYAYDAALLAPDAEFGPGKSFTAGTLMDMAKPRFNGSAKLFNVYDYVPGPSGGMFKQLLDEQYRSLVDLENRRGNFNDGAFAGLLESVREYAGAGYIHQSAAGRADPEDMLRMARGQETGRYFFKLNNNLSLINQYTRDSGRRIMIRTTGSSAGIEDDDAVAGIKADRDGKIPFSFTQAYGMNAASGNKRTAWEFLKFLLSDEIQTSTALSPLGLPLNNRARAEKGELIISGAFMGRGTPLDEKQREALEKYRTAVEALSDQINSYLIRDQIIDDMIASEARYFFEGAKTAEEAAAVLQNRVNLYLQE
jgi:multiple sugar transport system substrate-binding protein